MTRVMRRNVKTLWETNRWDGPLSGLCQYRGQHYRFFCFNDLECHGRKTRRKYAMRLLEPEEIADVMKRWKDFRDAVGEHCDYIDGTWKRIERDGPKPGWEKFYNLGPDGKPLTPRPPRVVVPMEQELALCNLWFSYEDDPRKVRADKLHERSWQVFDKMYTKMERRAP